MRWNLWVVGIAVFALSGCELSSGSSGNQGASGETVPVWMAIGKIGRTVYSCDEGQTWRGNRSDNPSFSCDGVDCDHRSDGSIGLAYANGAFFAAFGWGAPGTLRKTTDGTTWETVFDDAVTSPAKLGRPVFGSGRLVLARPAVYYSDNDGTSWTQAASTNSIEGYNVRAVHYSEEQALFVFVGDTAAGGGRDVSFSSDGSNWILRPTPNGRCTGYVRGVTSGNGRIVIVDNDGEVCVTDDAGVSWTGVDLALGADTIDGNVVFQNGEFWTWTFSTAHHSADGDTWSSNIVTGSPRFDQVFAMPNGYVISVGGWGNWYNNERVYVSSNGIDWQVINPGFGTTAHPLTHVVAGELPIEACN